MAWAGGDRFGSLATRAQLADLETHKVRTLVTASKGHEIAWLRGDDASLTYTEQFTQTDATGVDRYTWAIHLVDLKTGKDRVVDTSSTPGSKNHLPSPSLSSPWLVWDKAITDTSFDIFAVNTRTAQKIRVVHAENVQDAMADQASVIWIRLDGRPGRVEGDLMRTDLKSLASSRIRASHRVGRVFARDGVVAFSELGEDGRTSSVWRMNLPAARPTQVARADAYNVVAGTHFTAWLQNDDIVIKLVGESAPRVVVRGRVAVIARLYATAGRLAYGTVQLDSHSNITNESLQYLDVP